MKRHTGRKQRGALCPPGGLNADEVTVLINLVVYVLYAVIGTAAAAAAKIAMTHLLARRWVSAFSPALIALGLALGNFALLGFLLLRADMSAAAPMAIGVNLIMAALFARFLFRERLDLWKLSGMAALLAGVSFLAWG